MSGAPGTKREIGAGMSAESAQREPTMEEILASIRKIISEDEAASGEETLDLASVQPDADALEDTSIEPVAEIEEAPPEPALSEPAPPELEPEPEPEPVVEAAEPEPEPEPEPAPVAEPEPDVMFVEREEPEPPRPAPQPASSAPEGILADAAAQKTAGALGKLMGSMMVSTGNTLDDVVRELLRPMLKEWLDENLPTLVEAEVSRELDRIRRMAR